MSMGGRRGSDSAVIRIGKQVAIEPLEPRRLLSAAIASVIAPSLRLEPDAATGVGGYTPQQIRHAYGYDQVTFSDGNVQADGSGQTIAIVDAYDDPNIASDLAIFDRQFGIAAPP